MKKANLLDKNKLSRSPTIEEWNRMIKQKKVMPQLIQDILTDEKGEYMVLAGRTGIGKTNLILDLAFCLATGTPFFGLKCEKTIVNYMAFEGDPSNMRDRYLKLRRNFPATEGQLYFEMLPIESPLKLTKEVFGKLKKTDGCKVIILDPIRYIVLGDYLKPLDVAAFIGSFKELLTICGASAIITLPIRKPYAAKGIIRPGDVYSIKGATEYVDGATSVLLVEKRAYSQQRSRNRQNSGDSVTLSFAKHRIATRELTPVHLQFDRNKCKFEPKEGLIDRGDYSEITLRMPNK